MRCREQSFARGAHMVDRGSADHITRMENEGRGRVAQCEYALHVKRQWGDRGCMLLQGSGVRFWSGCWQEGDAARRTCICLSCRLMFFFGGGDEGGER